MVLLFGQTRKVEEVEVAYCVGGRSGTQGVKTKHSAVPEHFYLHSMKRLRKLSVLGTAKYFLVTV